MRLARGPRPGAIRLFAVAFLAQALAAFGHAVTRLAETQAVLAAGAPGLAIDRELTIVAVSARLTIALIPVALVWLLASPLARWLVLALTLGKLAMLPANLAELASGDGPAPVWIAGHVLTAIAAALLFTPGAARWFRTRGRPVAPIFD